MLIEILFKKVLPPFFESILDKKKKEDVGIIKEKMASATYKLFFYVFSTAWNLKITYGQPWLSTSLGGTGKVEDFLNDAMYGENKDLRMYLTVVAGYHVGSTVNFLRDSKKADYAGGLKMLAHHLSTVCLYFGGYAANTLQG